ncbi:Transmembrane_domain-containing protein [Hexamita inflata]|uniref:Transmembrane domain-containing protein n=1 Tax=Hexamita inflata TaxID=28002 RepID=A0AA86PQD6_9EUKA|nr:Transmembrane domain-containing protein [Hexamita inflata]
MKQFYPITPEISGLIQAKVIMESDMELKSRLVPLTSKMAKKISVDLLQQITSPDTFTNLTKDLKIITEQQFQQPLPTEEQQRQAEYKMYKHFAGQVLSKNISETSLSAPNHQRMIPLSFGACDVMATALTLGALGWFLAFCRSLPYPKQTGWACTGFVFGLALDITIYLMKIWRADKVAKEKGKQTNTLTKFQKKDL